MEGAVAEAIFSGGTPCWSPPVCVGVCVVPVVVHGTVEVSRRVVRTTVVWSEGPLVGIKVVETEPLGRVTQ